MFLQSVTLRGFKSFADKTTLAFEPGITVVVGPNGSGKSNIVDALTWVLGTHSAKSLRGGSMSDVIFAGAPGRSALGRASVEIHIDNASGTLPIEFSEVTVSRAMYASGENDYAINGVDCRLLDVAELLSDTGLGRENHTIVGQGRLDAILNARPEERRAFIEEAAGILKHRRRKERALRKLTQMEEHLERLTDLLRELKRQLRPLERQAEAAARHAELRARRDEISCMLALREFDALSVRLEEVRGVDDRLGARLATLETDIDQVRTAEAEREAELAASEPRARQVAATHVQLSTVTERFRGLIGRIEERRTGLTEAVEEPVAGRDPQQLRHEADEQEAHVADLDEQSAAAEQRLDSRGEERREAERARRAHEQAAAAEARRRSEARERQLRWEGQVSTLRSALAQAAGEEGRLSAQISGLEDHQEGLRVDVAGARDEIQQLDAAAPKLSARLSEAEAKLVRRTDIVDDLARAERDLERDRASLQARSDALRATAAHADEGAAAVIAAAESGQLSGVLGALSAHLEVADGMGPAVAAALGRLGDALVVDTKDHAQSAVGFARAGSGRVLLLAGADTDAPRDVDRDAEIDRAGGQPLIAALSTSPPVHAALTWTLRDVYTTPDLDTAAALARTYPGCSFVTADGESAGARGWAGGTASEPTAVLALAGAEEAERRLESVEEELAILHRQLTEADRNKERSRDEVDGATVLLQESDGRITAAAERLGRLETELDRCERQLAERQAQAAGLATDMAERQQRLSELEARGIEEVEDEPEGPDLEAERLDDVLTAAREAEVQARLESRSLQNRRAEAARRVAGLRGEADDVERQLAEREARRVARVAAVARCGELLELAGAGLEGASRSLSQAETERDTVEAQRATWRESLGALRARLRELDGEQSELTSKRHAAALSRGELETAATGLRERLSALREGDDPDELLERARAERTAGGDEAALTGGSERDDELRKAQRRLERQLGLLGDVNPLAKLEFERLTERHGFMESQLNDLRASRDDLREVVEAVDRRIREVFAAAFADVSDAFDTIFPRLFPGGEGHLVLTDPEDLLTTGVEVEARPAGKRVKRLSLLSGGERSLTALAIMFAIFSARPSPFYVLDEVEAALDDVNLQRFLDIVTDFRSSSQVIIVSHQKRTMEIADLLYGVSMQRDGVSKVISQRAAELTTGH